VPLHMDGRWVTTWGASQQLTEPSNMPPAPGLKNNTLRQVLHVSLGGKRLRLKFSNVFGDGPISIGSAHIASFMGGSSIAANNERALVFQGSPSVTISPEEEVSCDPFDYDVAPLSDLAVSVYFTEMPAAITGHPGSRCTSYIEPGDAVSALDLPEAVPVVHWYILACMEVWTPPNGAAVAILGDSITDGWGSTTDGNDRWPDVLAWRLQGNPHTAHVAVVNAGIGGNSVLRGGLGPTALSRFARDVLNASGVRWLIVCEGVNDIGTRMPLSGIQAGAQGADGQTAAARDLIAAYEQMIDRARAAGILVYGATLTPFEGHSYSTPESESSRQAVNEWIRTSGRFDSVIDMEAAVRNPRSTASLTPAADSGDHLHLSPAGYRMLAETVDLGLFAR
jgi:lysophospholipase L1-like esterase